jgi:hypothetical protein
VIGFTSRRARRRSRLPLYEFWDLFGVSWAAQHKKGPEPFRVRGHPLNTSYFFIRQLQYPPPVQCHRSRPCHRSHP